jgi:cytoskeleton protein RodZ
MSDKYSDQFDQEHDHSENESFDENVTIGKYLKFERELREVSLKVVSQHTKISLTMLSYLENEEYERLPDLAYVRGFVKNYSKALGISTVAALEVLEDTYIMLNKETVDINTHAESLQNPEPIESGGNLKLIGIVVIVIAFIAIIAAMTREDNSTTENSMATVEASPTPTPVVKAKVIKPTTLSVNTPLNKEIPTPKATAVPEATSIVVATPIPTATATPESTKVADTGDDAKKEDEKSEEENKKEEKKEIKFKTLSRSLYSVEKNSEEALKEFVPLTYRESIVSGKQNLYIAARDGETWITYKVDQEPVKKIILREGSNLQVTGDEITAFLGNVHVTRIFLNNKLLKIVSRSGVKSLIFPQEIRAKHKYPLFIYNDDGTVTSSYEYLKMKEANEN